MSETPKRQHPWSLDRGNCECGHHASHHHRSPMFDGPGATGCEDCMCLLSYYEIRPPLVFRGPQDNGRCPRQVDGGRCAGLEGHAGACYANARDRAAGNG